jgi:alcohol dehydrogenase class IV
MAGLRTRLSELGEVDVDKLASECAAHPLMRNNPVEMTPEKLAELFRTLA